MIKYDFDTVIDRRGTGAMKYDALGRLYGNTALTPLWIADMEFAACPDIVKALIDRFMAMPKPLKAIGSQYASGLTNATDTAPNARLWLLFPVWCAALLMP